MILTDKRKAKLSKFFKFKKVVYLPFVLNMEPGNICNLSCPLCPTGKRDGSLKKGFLSFNFFKKIFDQIGGKLKVVNLYSWGEPLLNAELGKIINYIKNKNKKIKVITSTNLNVEDKNILDELISSGIDEIIVSCDGASEEAYKRYRVGGDFGLVIENMKYLVDKKKELNINAKIIWNFLVFKHNEHEVEKARQMAKQIGADFRAGLMRTSMKDEILKPHKDAIARDIEWIPDNPDYSAYDKERLLPKRIIKSCLKPWQEITVNWNGEVFPCCAVYGDNFSFADANKDPIIDIWNNRNFLQARKEILNKKEKPLTVCGLCRDNGFMHM